MDIGNVFEEDRSVGYYDAAQVLSAQVFCCDIDEIAFDILVHRAGESFLRHVAADEGADLRARDVERLAFLFVQENLNALLPSAHDGHGGNAIRAFKDGGNVVVRDAAHIIDVLVAENLEGHELAVCHARTALADLHVEFIRQSFGEGLDFLLQFQVGVFDVGAFVERHRDADVLGGDSGFDFLRTLHAADGTFDRNGCLIEQVVRV